MTFEAFRQDPKTIAAVERRLLVMAPFALAATLRGSVDLETVWNTVTNDLTPLRSAIEHALNAPDAGPVADGKKFLPDHPRP